MSKKSICTEIGCNMIISNTSNISKKNQGKKSVSMKTKWLVIGMHKTDLSNIEISRRLGISEKCVRTTLATSSNLELNSYHACKKPLLTPSARMKRLKCCKQHLDWSVERWKMVIFSDDF
jgi:hypothetical protein